MKKVMTARKAQRPRKDRRGKWSRDPWIRILELLAPMSSEERTRCIRATANFFDGR